MTCVQTDIELASKSTNSIFVFIARCTLSVAALCRVTTQAQRVLPDGHGARDVTITTPTVPPGSRFREAEHGFQRMVNGVAVIIFSRLVEPVEPLSNCRIENQDELAATDQRLVRHGSPPRRWQIGREF